MNIVQNDPSKAALLIKDFILQGIDTIADLYRRSVSNGRLNLFNSFCEMDNYFKNSTCFEEEKIELRIKKIVLNQAKDVAIVHFELIGKSSVKVRLFNITGLLMKQQQIPNINTGYHQLQLQLEDLNTGIYYINFNTKNAMVSETIVVH